MIRRRVVRLFVIIPDLRDTVCFGVDLFVDGRGNAYPRARKRPGRGEYYEQHPGRKRASRQEFTQRVYLSLEGRGIACFSFPSIRVMYNLSRTSSIVKCSVILWTLIYLSSPDHFLNETDQESSPRGSQCIPVIPLQDHVGGGCPPVLLRATG